MLRPGERPRRPRPLRRWQQRRKTHALRVRGPRSRRAPVRREVLQGRVRLERPRTSTSRAGRPGATSRQQGRTYFRPLEHTSHPLEHPPWNHPVPRASNDSTWCLVSYSFRTPSRSSTTQRILTQMFRFSVSPRSSGVTPRTKPCGPKRGAESSGTHVKDNVVRSSDREADSARSVSGTL